MNSKVLLFFLDNKYLSSYILIPLLFIHVINCLLEHKYINKKKYKNSKAKTNSKNGIMITYILIVILATLLILTKIPIIKYVINIINFGFLMYILIIEPIFSKKLSYDFIESNTVMSSFLFTELTYLIINCKLELFSSIQSEVISQLFIISYLFSMIFLITYILFINLKFILYYLCSNILNTLKSKIKQLITMLNDKYNLNIIDSKLQKQTSKITIIIVATKELIIFTCIIGVVSSLLNAIYYFIGIFNNCFSKIQNEDIYVIAKTSVFITLFIIYFIIQICNFFNPTIVSSYEFVASTIIIPLLLEALVKRNSGT